MPVDPKKAQRRPLRFERLTDAVADAERLLEAGYTPHGNWSLGQIGEHLAKPLHWTIDGYPLKAPLPIRLMGTYVLKNRLITKGFPSGVKLKRKFAVMLPTIDTAKDAEGVTLFREAVDRFTADPSQATQPNPLVGSMTPEQYEQFHCRHAELHLSFLEPRRRS